MLVYATLQVSIKTLPKDTAEFNQLMADVKKNSCRWSKVLIDITDIFTQWQQIRRELLVLDQDIFGRSVDDIEDQLDLMSLATLFIVNLLRFGRNTHGFKKHCIAFGSFAK